MDLWQTILSFFSGLEDLLDQTASSPVFYSISFFFYAVLATAILPLPIELGLLLSPNTPFLWLAAVLGLGRVVGGIIVFYTGHQIGRQAHDWFYRWNWSSQVMDWLKKVIFRLGYIGLFIIMSIPFMLDSLPLYAYSLADEKRGFNIRWFALTNFLAGVMRAVLFSLLLELFGIGVFHSLL